MNVENTTLKIFKRDISLQKKILRAHQAGIRKAHQVCHLGRNSWIEFPKLQEIQVEPENIPFQRLWKRDLHGKTMVWNQYLKFVA